MTWQSLKESVREKVRIDAASYVDLDTLAYGSSTDTAMWNHFQLFCQAAREFYYPNVELTLSTNDQQIDLLDAAVSPHPLFSVTRLWIAEREIRPYDFDALQLAYPQNGTITATAPSAFAMSDEGEIYLNAPLDATTAAADGHIAAGFAFHDDLDTGTEDATVINLTRVGLEAAAEYIAVALARPVVTEQSAVGRVQSYANSANDYMARRKAKQIAKASMASVVSISQVQGTGSARF